MLKVGQTSICKEIKIRAFIAEDKLPTCAIGPSFSEACPLLGSRKFGTVDVCLASQQDIFRRDAGRGYMHPCTGCLIWTQEELICGK
jgi:hypothetical protein